MKILALGHAVESTLGTQYARAAGVGDPSVPPRHLVSPSTHTLHQQPQEFAWSPAPERPGPEATRHTSDPVLCQASQSVQCIHGSL